MFGLADFRWNVAVSDQLQQRGLHRGGNKKKESKWTRGLWNYK